MDASKDYYAILGILPSAEYAVIRAAYRALAQLYHPDKFAGSRDESHRRMADINEAYEILSNAATRNQYNAARGPNAKAGDPYFGEMSGEATPTPDPLDRDWGIALKYYPDLDALESGLRLFSWRIAYSFRAYLLEAKRFEERNAVADAIEQQFLETYFGSDPRIVAFARDLIILGNRHAAKELNEAIRVLGAQADPPRLIERIRMQFLVREPNDFERFRAFAKRLRRWGHEESDIRHQLETRGMRSEHAGILARMVSRDTDA
jgi:curved DNA-binding protein CbpA